MRIVIKITKNKQFFKEFFVQNAKNNISEKDWYI